jgi:hypothetical protein
MPGIVTTAGPPKPPVRSNGGTSRSESWCLSYDLLVSKEHATSRNPEVDATNLLAKLLIAATPSIRKKVVAFFKGKQRVVVLGSTGTGKSQLIRSLKELIPAAISYDDRTNVADDKPLTIRDSVFVIWDTPGQSIHEDERNRAIRSVQNTPYGILNVVSYGYHEYRATVKDAVKDGRADPDFLARHRQVEIDLLRRSILLMDDDPNLAFFFTIITKSDLWWHERDNVLDHYEKGDYASVLSELNFIGPKTAIGYCSVLHPFFGTAASGGSYSDEDRMKARNELLTALVSAASSAKRRNKRRR